MENKKKFVASFTATTNAAAHDVWAIWTDVNGWSKWDCGIETSYINDVFKAGSYFSLTPKGGEAIDVQLKTATPGEEFSDEAILPFGVIRNIHRLELLGDNLKITHEVEAEIEVEMVALFTSEIWPHMQYGLTDAVKNIVGLVGSEA